MFHDPLNDGIAIDSFRDCHAHALVPERIFDRATILGLDEWRIGAVMVEVEIDDSIRDALKQADVLIAFEAFDIGGRHRGDYVDVACKLSGNAGRA